MALSETLTLAASPPFARSLVVDKWVADATLDALTARELLTAFDPGTAGVNEALTSEASIDAALRASDLPAGIAKAVADRCNDYPVLRELARSTPRRALRLGAFAAAKTVDSFLEGSLATGYNAINLGILQRATKLIETVADEYVIADQPRVMELADRWIADVARREAFADEIVTDLQARAHEASEDVARTALKDTLTTEVSADMLVAQFGGLSPKAGRLALSEMSDLTRKLVNVSTADAPLSFEATPIDNYATGARRAMAVISLVAGYPRAS